VQQPSCDTETVFKNATACGANQHASVHICGRRGQEGGGKWQSEWEKINGAALDWLVLSAHSMAQTQNI